MHVQVKFPCSGQQEMLPELHFFTPISHNINRWMNSEVKSIDHLVTMFCWETFCPDIHVIAIWHAPPAQKPL